MSDTSPAPVRRFYRRVTRLGLALLVVAVVLPLGAFGWLAHHRSAARAAADRRDYATALGHLDACLTLAPSSADLQFLAARTARRAGQRGRAVGHLDRLKAAEGPSERYAIERSLLSAQAGLVSGQEEIRLRNLVVDGHPDAEYILEASTLGYLANGQLNPALFCASELLRLQPDHGPAHAWRGWARHRLHLLEDAQEDFARAVELDPEHDDARLQLAYVLLDRRLPGEAQPHLERLETRRPGQVRVLFGLARCRLTLGTADETAALLDRVLALEPRHAQALAERGRLALTAGDNATAEGLLRRATAAAPDDHTTRYSLAQALDRLGRTADAAACRTEADQVKTDVNRLRDIDRLAAEKSVEPAMCVEAGRICLRWGRAREGLQWLHAALRQAPRHAPAHAALAEHYAAVGDGERSTFHRRLSEGTPP